VTDICRVGDPMLVKAIAVDDQDRVKLSRKAAMAERGDRRPERRQPRRRGGGGRPPGDRPPGGDDRGGDPRRPAPRGPGGPPGAIDDETRGRADA
jgi:polyribonucleotide nucleotidyltransferase